MKEHEYIEKLFLLRNQRTADQTALDRRAELRTCSFPATTADAAQIPGFEFPVVVFVAFVPAVLHAKFAPLVCCYKVEVLALSCFSLRAEQLLVVGVAHREGDGSAQNRNKLHSENNYNFYLINRI